MGDLRGKKILVVDDDIDFLNQMMLGLERENATVFLAEGEIEANEVLKDHKPDLGIIDLMMEHVDGGFALCRKIKKTYPGTPVIMVTNVAGDAGSKFDKAAGKEESEFKFDLLLKKPIRLDQLKRDIVRLLKGLTIA